MSGTSKQVLAQCPTEKPKFIGLGTAILVTAGMAAVSMAFALYNALKAPLWAAVIFALLWGVAILCLDRLFVVSMHRQRNWLYYLVLAAPRFIMAVLLGFVISTPFVLQIFQPEISREIQNIHNTERAAYFNNLPHSALEHTIQQDQATVTNLTNQAATGGTAINPATDPTIEGWSSQLTKDQANEQTWFANLQCQLYGTALPGGRKCIQGNGPLAKDDQAQYDYWKGLVSTLQGEIQQRTTLLRQQSVAKQNAAEVEARSQLKIAQQALQSEQQLLAQQTKNVISGISNDKGLLTQLAALNEATSGSSTLEWARILLFLVFLFIDSTPVFIKLLLNLAPESTYDTLLAAEENRQKMAAEHARAVRLATERKAAQAGVSGARDRIAALSAELPGIRDEITAARLRVEREWLQRWEADQMQRVANGQGISPTDTGVGPMPMPDVRRRPMTADRFRGRLGSLLRLSISRLGRRSRQEPRRQAGPMWRPWPGSRPGTRPEPSTDPRIQRRSQLDLDATQPGRANNNGSGANGWENA